MHTTSKPSDGFRDNLMTLHVTVGFRFLSRSWTVSMFTSWFIKLCVWVANKDPRSFLFKVVIIITLFNDTKILNLGFLWVIGRQRYLCGFTFCWLTQPDRTSFSHSLKNSMRYKSPSGVSVDFRRYDDASEIFRNKQLRLFTDYNIFTVRTPFEIRSMMSQDIKVE